MPERQPSHPRPTSPDRVRRLARAVIDAHAVVDLHELGVDVTPPVPSAESIRRTLQERIDALASGARGLAKNDDLRDASEAVVEAHAQWATTAEGTDARRRAALELVFALLWLHDEIRVYEIAS